jgi:predicted amidohydrolase
MKIATVQFAPTYLQKAANLKALANMVSEAARNGARLVVLPELCTTGYSFMNKEEAATMAEAISPEGWTCKIMQALAGQFNIHIVFGMVEQNLGKLYNSQVCMSPFGVAATVQKLNRWANDFLWAEAGRTNPPVVDIEGHRVGLLICRDVRDKVNSNWTDLYSPGDADFVCLSANWGKGGFPSTSWMDFVEENKMGLVVSNRYGLESNNDFGEGGICAIARNGKVHCEGLKWSANCIVYADMG